jgi:hypothetical protein
MLNVVEFVIYVLDCVCCEVIYFICKLFFGCCHVGIKKGAGFLNKKNVNILHLWTVLADVKRDAFTSVKMLLQM